MATISRLRKREGRQTGGSASAGASRASAGTASSHKNRLYTLVLSFLSKGCGEAADILAAQLRTSGNEQRHLHEQHCARLKCASQCSPTKYFPSRVAATKATTMSSSMWPIPSSTTGLAHGHYVHHRGRLMNDPCRLPNGYARRNKQPGSSTGGTIPSRCTGDESHRLGRTNGDRYSCAN